MKVIVLPSRSAGQIEPIVRQALADVPGSGDVSLTVMRVSYPGGWSVQASGLGDPLRERGFCEIVEDALRRARI